MKMIFLTGRRSSSKRLARENEWMEVLGLRRGTATGKHNTAQPGSIRKNLTQDAPSHHHHLQYDRIGSAAACEGKFTGRVGTALLLETTQALSTAGPAQHGEHPARFSLALCCPQHDLPQHGSEHCQGHTAETVLAGQYHPLGTEEGQGLISCGLLLRVIPLVVVCGSCCQKKPHRGRTKYHHTGLFSLSPAAVQSLVWVQELSQQLTAEMATAP